MKKIVLVMFSAMLLVGCGQSYEEAKEQSARERAMQQKKEAEALKVGVLPTIDCLPMFIIKEREWIDTAKADVRFKDIESHIAADDALRKGIIEGSVTDIVRAERMKRQGVALTYVASTPLSWQFITNKKARIKELKQLTDKMIAMSRFSATAMLADMAVDSSKLKSEYVFRVQVNNPQIRLKMLINNEMDAALLPEPQATAARIAGNPVLMDAKNRDLRMGAIVFTDKAMNDSRRRSQIDAFIKAYNQACDSINHYGIANYAGIIKKYMDVDNKTVRSIPKIKFEHAARPREKDIAKANSWLR